MKKDTTDKKESTERKDVELVKKDLIKHGWRITHPVDKVENRPATPDEQILFAIKQIREYCHVVENIIAQKPVDISEYKTKEEIHWIQKGLLNLNKKGMLTGKGYRKIARLVGIKHPQQIKYHLTQLRKHKLI